MSIKFSRRNLILAAGTFTALALLGKRQLIDKYGPRKFKGQVGGANFNRGHRLIQKKFPKVSKTLKTKISIVGAGVSGLSCAYHLSQQGQNEIFLFDLENHLGGNSTSMNKSAPWGAHYLPLVNLDNHSLLKFLKQTKIIKNFDEKGIPEYDELMVCSDPMEKLFIYGRMQEGIVPLDHIPAEDKAKMMAFKSEMKALSTRKGRDGKYAFNIPAHNSSQDRDFLKLDKMTMLEYLQRHNFSCDSVNWYVNYCCRDDFGTPIESISAWAGIHYFASRRGKGAGIHEDSVLTWPEGNHFLVEKLVEYSNIQQIFTGHMLFDVTDKNLLFYDFQQNQTIQVESDQIVLALPQFILAKIFYTQTEFQYSPWLVANIKVKWDREIENALAWDNVNYHGHGIGFVVANHQKLNTIQSDNILTYYWPLSHLRPKEARQFAIQRTHEQWSQDILKDIAPMIPDIEDRIIDINFWPWGHAMVMPEKNFFLHKRASQIKIPFENIHVAHTDLSGLSIFEEGFYQGEEAARNVLKGLSLK